MLLYIMADLVGSKFLLQLKKKKRGLFYVPFGSLMEISITDNCKGADGWGVR